MDEILNIHHSFVVTSFDIFRTLSSTFVKNGANVTSNDIKVNMNTKCTF